MFGKKYTQQLEEKVFNEAMALAAGGKKIVGLYCAFTPKEIVGAAGAVPVSLCSGSEAPIQAASAHLPMDLCPLIQSSYGHALEDTCPYFHSADMLLADATCDGKKKMFELLKRIKPVHLLHLPQTAETPGARDYWRKEVKRAVKRLEGLTGNRVTKEALKEQISRYKRFRAAKKTVFELNRGDAPLVYGSEIKAITGMSGFECNLDARIEEIEEAVSLIRQRAEAPAFEREISRKKRILLTGCPTTNKKLLHLIEQSGAVVTAMENCGGLKTLGNELGQQEDLLDSLADRYLKTACPCMTPNAARLDLIGDIIAGYGIQGVVDLTWDACHTYNVESFQVNEFVTRECGIPFMQIRTDYSENDTGQLKTRVEAFLEML